MSKGHHVSLFVPQAQPSLLCARAHTHSHSYSLLCKSVRPAHFVSSTFARSLSRSRSFKSLQPSLRSGYRSLRSLTNSDPFHFAPLHLQPIHSVHSSLHFVPVIVRCASLFGHCVPTPLHGAPLLTHQSLTWAWVQIQPNYSLFFTPTLLKQHLNNTFSASSV